MKTTVIITLFSLIIPACSHRIRPMEDFKGFEVLHSKGKVLRVKYNKPTDTMAVIYNGEILELKQDVTASGVPIAIEIINIRNGMVRQHYIKTGN